MVAIVKKVVLYVQCSPYHANSEHYWSFVKRILQNLGAMYANNKIFLLKATQSSHMGFEGKMYA